jgi:hypothetical protein
VGVSRTAGVAVAGTEVAVAEVPAAAAREGVTGAALAAGNAEGEATDAGGGGSVGVTESAGAVQARVIPSKMKNKTKNRFLSDITSSGNRILSRRRRLVCRLITDPFSRRMKEILRAST